MAFCEFSKSKRKVIYFDTNCIARYDSCTNRIEYTMIGKC